jgi:hypothetical protein
LFLTREPGLGRAPEGLGRVSKSAMVIGSLKFFPPSLSLETSLHMHRKNLPFCSHCHSVLMIFLGCNLFLIRGAALTKHSSLKIDHDLPLAAVHPISCNDCEKPTDSNNFDEIARWVRCLGAPHNASDNLYENRVSLEGSGPERRYCVIFQVSERDF